MNYKKFLRLTKDCLDAHLATHARGDLPISPRIEKEDLLNYIKKFYSGFSDSRFSRFVSRLKHNRIVLESNDKSLLFDPGFLH